MKERRAPQIAGWVAVGCSCAISCVWAFWGIIENYHEGWYAETLLQNLVPMFLQYLSPMLIFVAITLVSIRWPRVGGGLHGAAAVFLALFFNALNLAVLFFILLPLGTLGILHWFGRPRPRRLAFALAVGLPLLTTVAAGVGPAVRVSQRLIDGNLGARLVVGSGVSLVWAPAGPGWPRNGTDWHGARDACRRLTGDGLALANVPQDVWRLPTVDEAVRSMARHGVNSGGRWDPETARATYSTTPDKESPLWDVHSLVIYWWTATEADEEHAYIVVYNGQVWPRDREYGPPYLGYRCVRAP